MMKIAKGVILVAACSWAVVLAVEEAGSIWVRRTVAKLQ